MNSSKLAGTGLISAVAASLCCITPVLTLIAGTGSLATSFSWIEPARPYLIGLTVLVLGLSWYWKLKPVPKDECGCEPSKKQFLQSKAFLVIITVFSALMITFPVYSKYLYPKTVVTVPATDSRTNNATTVEMGISGMTCAACEDHVAYELKKVPGVSNYIVSYENKNAIVTFDSTKTNIGELSGAVNATGYKVTNTIIKDKF